MESKIYNSVGEQAEAEVLAELRKETVEKLKSKYLELHKAKAIVANIEREIEDLIQAAEQGN